MGYIRLIKDALCNRTRNVVNILDRFDAWKEGMVQRSPETGSYRNRAEGDASEEEILRDLGFSEEHVEEIKQEKLRKAAEKAKINGEREEKHINELVRETISGEKYLEKERIKKSSREIQERIEKMVTNGLGYGGSNIENLGYEDFSQINLMNHLAVLDHISSGAGGIFGGIEGYGVFLIGGNEKVLNVGRKIIYRKTPDRIFVEGNLRKLNTGLLNKKSLEDFLERYRGRTRVLDDLYLSIKEGKEVSIGDVDLIPEQDYRLVSEQIAKEEKLTLREIGKISFKKNAYPEEIKPYS